MKEMQLMINQKGFSLLELLVAISILSVGLLAAATMQGTALRGNSFANIHSVSTAIAQQIMTDLTSVDSRMGTPWYEKFNNADTYIYDRFPPYNGSNAPVDSFTLMSSGVFTATYTVSPNTPSQNILRIKVQLYWNGKPVPFTLYGHKLISSN